MKENTIHISSVRVAVTTGLGGIVIGLAAAVVGVAAGSATTGIVVRAVLITALLAATARAACRAGLPRSKSVAAFGLGYALDIAWWGGSAYAARLVVDSAPLAAVADLVLWTAVGVIAATMHNRRAPMNPR